MNLEDLKSKKIAILGFSVEGLSVAKWLSYHLIPFTILEKNPMESLLPEAQNFLKDFDGQFVSGPDHLKPLSGFEIISRSQGVPLWLPELVVAKDKGAEITSMTKLFFDFCPCPIIGVTGTKGKGTTSTLIYEMLKASGKDVYLGGNIGRPPLDFIVKLTKDSVVILELSSFQLEDLNKSPHTAVVLMVTQEHLDSNAADSPNYHRSVEDYVEAKKNIVRFQGKSDVAVINNDFERSRATARNLSSNVFYFSVKKEVENGAFLSGNELILNINGKKEILCQKNDIFLRGEHNIQNILAAVTASVISGADHNKVREVIKTFRGLEHRLEFVREVNGVSYYDDSFSTTPETAIAAIESFNEPEIVILGGSEKGSDYAKLGETIAETKNIKAIILIGKTAVKIKEAISKKHTPKDLIFTSNLLNMGDIVTKAESLSISGDVVILSPACASFDMFKNYKDRGEQFKKAVMNL